MRLRSNFIRPGLSITIKSVKIAADGTVTTDFTIADPKGIALDRDGVLTPGAVSTSFILAYIPQGQTQYVSYTTRLQTDPNGKVPNAVQATADSGGTYTKVADGEYIYTFAKKLPTDYEKSSTHTMGVYGSRNLTEFDLGTQYDDKTFNFVPDGSKVTVTRDVIKTQSCNKCHDQLAFHGGSRRGMELCIMCHTPQTTDSGSGNTVDMKVFIHKLHNGKHLPSVWPAATIRSSASIMPSELVDSRVPHKRRRRFLRRRAEVRVLPRADHGRRASQELGYQPQPRGLRLLPRQRQLRHGPESRQPAAGPTTSCAPSATSPEGRTGI